MADENDTTVPTAWPTASPTAVAPVADHHFGAANTVLLVVLLMLCTLAGYLLQEKRIGYLPESGASMLIGMIVGGIIRAVITNEAEMELIKFNPLIFFFVLLPPIIFEAGFTLKKKRFFNNIVAISLYAVVGTFISTFVVGFLTYICALMGLIGVDDSSPLQSLLFGSLISSVDPVATLAILGSSEANCDPLLYSLVFGESVLNDAVAIVLFHVMNSYASDEKTFQGSDILVVMARFLAMTLASIAIGVATGLLCSFVFKISNVHSYHAYEIQLLFLFSFGCFALAELVSMSGVVALFFCALTLAHYNYYNMSVQTQISSRYVFEGIAKTSETVVFAYMGVSIFTSRSAWSPVFVFLGTVFCVAGRAANIYPMSWIANRFRSEKISDRMQKFMFFSGLRGAVSYALSTQLDANTGSPYGIEIIQTTTLGIVIITTFFLGGTTSFVLDRLDLKHDRSRAGSNQLREDFAAYHEMPSVAHPVVDVNEPVDGRPPSRGVRARRQIQSFWRRFDNNYMKPLFGGKGNRKYHIPPALFQALQDGTLEGNTAAGLIDSAIEQDQGAHRGTSNSSVLPMEEGGAELDNIEVSELRQVGVDGADSEAPGAQFAEIRRSAADGDESYRPPVV